MQAIDADTELKKELSRQQQEARGVAAFCRPYSSSIVFRRHEHAVVLQSTRAALELQVKLELNDMICISAEDTYTSISELENALLDIMSSWQCQMIERDISP